VADLPFKWPVLGFGPDVGPWSDFLVRFSKAEQFETCGSWSLKNGARAGMILVDSSGRCWEMVALRKLDVAGSFWTQILRFLIRQVVYNVEADLIEQAPITLEQVKARVVETVVAHSHQWIDDEALAGEAGKPQTERAQLKRLKERVSRAKSVAAVMRAANVEVAE
jgi:hypothetical protein